MTNKYQSRYARKSDKNQPGLVKLWQQHGKLWVSTDKQGGGAPDGFLLHRGLWLAIEIKSRTGTLTKPQQDLHAQIADKGGIVYIIRTEQDALDLINVKT